MCITINKVLFIINPVSGIKDNYAIGQAIGNQLNSHNIQFDVLYTTHAGHAKEYVHTIDANLYDSILILGGDGTINEILNGILLRLDGYLPIFGFLPGGTGNSVLHDLEYLDPITALKPVLNHKTKYIDVMALKFNNLIEYSINILGWGLVADIALFAEKLRFLGQSRYDIASLYYILKLQSRSCTLILDNKQYSDEYLFILVHNTIHTGKGMKAAPKARLDDGLIDVLVINKDVNRLQLLQLLSRLSTGSHIKSRYVKYFQVANVELIPNIDEGVNIDGDVKYITPVKISVLHKKLPIFY
tara:strand:+ start:860 stop:1762 length:903 start_codon:yes stop_codon:yes gene_type:complete